MVLVGHGGVPKDLPRAWVREMKLCMRRAAEEGDATLRERALELERRIRTFPRTDETDPYGAGIRRLAAHLASKLDGWPVIVAYNEFCVPTIEEAIAEAVGQGAERIDVLTTMITPGGSHSEVDIPEALARARARHVGVTISFVWPLDLDAVAAMYAAQLPPLEGPA